MSPKLCAALCFSGWPCVLWRALSRLAMPKLRPLETARRNAVSSGGSCLLVPQAGIEPARLAAPNFESGASTDSATRAWCLLRVSARGVEPLASGLLGGDLPLIYTRINHTEVRAGVEPASRVARVCSATTPVFAMSTAAVSCSTMWARPRRCLPASPPHLCVIELVRGGGLEPPFSTCSVEVLGH